MHMTRTPQPGSTPLPGTRIGHAVPLSVEEALAAGLSPMTMATLNDQLTEWCTERDYRGVSTVTGGWEEWVQVELVGWLHGSLGARVEKRWDVQRNVRVYAEHDARADLVFNQETHDAYRPLLVIEILAESPLVPRPDFLNRMHYEAEQLRAARVQPAYATARRMLLALTVDPTTPTVLQRHGFGAVASTPNGCSAMWREMGA